MRNWFSQNWFTAENFERFMKKNENLDLKKLYWRKWIKILTGGLTTDFWEFKGTLVVWKTENDAKRRGRTGSRRINHNQNHKRHHTQGIII